MTAFSSSNNLPIFPVKRLVNILKTQSLELYNPTRLKVIYVTVASLLYVVLFVLVPQSSIIESNRGNVRLEGVDSSSSSPRNSVRILPIIIEK